MTRGPPSERSPAELLEFGVVNLDKPPGPSAHQVVAWLRDMVGLDRAAHAGTLDPKVTGSLPVLLGDATRMAQVFDDAVKEYVTVLELHGEPPPDLREVIAEFEGPIYQKPPRKSAVVRRLRPDHGRPQAAGEEDVSGRRPDGTAPSIRVLGFSQGAATASRWALLGDTAVDRLVLWGGAPAHDLDLSAHAERLRALDLTLVTGTDDPYVTEERRAAVRRRLDRHDIPVTERTFEGGHRLDDAVLGEIASEAA